ncbi:MAG: hypothetical protein FWG98_04870 [Candidatus Cloacimonetes bacterium]|nr:hypothetical protein [Candidatus Cloacimonadota bacterium]
MIQKPLFSLNTLHNPNSDVFIVLPSLNYISIDILSLCLEFTKKYKKLVLLCSEYEISFYSLLVAKSKSFSQFKDKVLLDTTSHLKLREIQLKDCIIIDLHHEQITIENAKRAIVFLPSNDSDIVFEEFDFKDDLYILNFLRILLKFLYIKEEKLLRNIDINSNDVIQASTVASNFSSKKYSVIFIKDMVSSIKIISFLKKNKLKKHLILVSKNPIGVADPKLLTLKEYNFLDLLAFLVQAESISCTKNSINKNIVSNLRINLSMFANFKDYSTLLYDITEPLAKNND